MGSAFLLLLVLPARAGTCTAWDDEGITGELVDFQVDESSGIATLRASPGVYATHQDSDGPEELVLFEADGTWRGTVPIDPDIKSWDWEDAAAGPCPAGTGFEHCVYIADVGDNSARREDVDVFVVPEPLPEQEEELPVLGRYRLVYPDGARDAEALVVHPCTGTILVVTKTVPAEVWEVPPEARDAEEPVPMALRATLPVDAWDLRNTAITGGGWDRDGERLALRTYGEILLWVTDPADPFTHWDARPEVLPDGLPGEAVGFSLDGDLLSTAEGHPMPIERIACLDLVPGDACGTAATGGGGDTAGGAAGGAEAAPPGGEPAGCGCGAGTAAGWWWMLVGPPLAARRRMRPRR